MLLASRTRYRAALAAAWLASAALYPVDASLASEWNQRTAPSRLQPAPPSAQSPPLVAYPDRPTDQPPAATDAQLAAWTSRASEQRAAKGGGHFGSKAHAGPTHGAAHAPQSRAPYMIGDLFGGAPIQLMHTPPAQPLETTISGFGVPTDPNNFESPIGFSLEPQGPILLISLAPGADTNGDEFPDTYGVPAPPPELTPMQPGAGQLTFNHGVLTFSGSPQVESEFVGDRPPPTNRDQAGQETPPQESEFASHTGAPGMSGYQLALQHTFQPQQIVVSVPSPGSGGGVGRVKISESTSPLPRDRVFHNFSYFQGVPLTSSGVNVTRFVPGFEKTLFGGLASVEMRFPLALTLDNDVLADGVTSTDEVNFGNISVPLKVLLYNNQTWALAAGVQCTVPTASDSRVFLSDGTQLIHIQNRSVHVMPYLGALWTPNDRLFAQAFFQIDAEAQGSPVTVNDGSGTLVGIGDLEDQTLLYVDLGVGYWLYQNEYGRGLTGLAPIVEIHVNQSLDDAKLLNAGSYLVGNLRSNITSTNLVCGANLQFGPNTSVTLGYAAPLSDNAIDFDGELRVLFNHRFGPSSRAARAQF